MLSKITALQAVRIDLPEVAKPLPLASPAQPTGSIIGRSLVLNGDMQSDDHLHIDGQINGNVRCRRLTIGKGGVVVGNVVAEEIVVQGRINGIIRSNTVFLQSTAQADGEIFYKILAMEHGAQFEGVSRPRENPNGMLDSEILAAAVEQGGNSRALGYLVRPVLSMSEPDRGDPVIWAAQLSLAVQVYDSEVLTTTASRIAARGPRCPTIAAIAAECERVDKEIGGQRTMSAAMYQIYACGVPVWNTNWGPPPGEPNCRLKREEQDHRWREVITLTRDTLVANGWRDAPASVIGLKIVEVLGRNAGGSVDKDGHGIVPRRIKAEFNIPTTAKAAAAARALLAEREERYALRHAEGSVSRPETASVAS